MQIHCLVIAEMQSSMSNLDVRSDFMSGSACDEEVPNELPIALLTEPFRDICRHCARCRGELNPQIPIRAYFGFLQYRRNCSTRNQRLSIHQQFVKSTSNHARREACCVPIDCRLLTDC